MFRTTSSSQQPAVPGQGRSDPNRIAPYLTHLVTHHGQPTLVPPQNAGRIRKSGKKNPERARGERRRDGDEPRFNTAAPTNPRGASRRGNNVSPRAARVPVAPSHLPRGLSLEYSAYLQLTLCFLDSMIPDYPPPSFQEAIMTPPFIPSSIPAETATEQPSSPTSAAGDIADTSSPQRVDVTMVPPPIREILQPPSLTVRTAVGPSGSTSDSPSSQQTREPQSNSSSSEESSSNSSSLEIVSYEHEHENEHGGWEEERQRGVPLDVRIHNEQRRLLMAESAVNLVTTQQDAPSGHLEPAGPNSSVIRNRCNRCSSPRSLSIRDHPLPQSSPDLTEDEPDDVSPPSSPKNKMGWKKLFTASHEEKEPTSPVSQEPNSPTSTFGFGMLQNAWSSTLTLASGHGSPSKPSGNPSPSSGKRRESFGVRRLFASKGKERGCSPSVPEEPEEPWEFVNRTSVIFQEEKQRDLLSKGTSPVVEMRQDAAAPSTSASGPRSTPRTNNSSSTPTTTPFLKRPVRHGATSNDTLALHSNQSVVSLPLSAESPTVYHSAEASDLGAQKRLRRPPPPPPPPRRKAMSTTVKPSSSAIRLAPLDTEGVSSSAHQHEQLLSPMSPVASPVGHSLTRPSLPVLRPSSPDGAGSVRTLPASMPSTFPYAALNASSATLATLAPRQGDPSPFAYALDLSTLPAVPAVPMIRYFPALPFLPPAPIVAADSASTISQDSPPRTPPGTPTTPSHHHYHGRPLPQPPRQPSPLARHAAVGASSPMAEYAPFTDLDVLAARVIEGDHDGHNYEVSRPT
jgi:hypothetical protein